METPSPPTLRLTMHHPLSSTYCFGLVSFWMVGAVYASILAWVILGTPSVSTKLEPDWRWRYFVMLAALPVFITLTLTIVFLPKSPRWLISKGRYHEASQTLYQ